VIQKTQELTKESTMLKVKKETMERLARENLLKASMLKNLDSINQNLPRVVE
jgi:hypothetical protein